MDTPLVSVVTPCYNGESYVTRFLESLLEQSYNNIQLIFVNDGSKDATEEIFNAYRGRLEAKFTEVKYIYQENAGVASAINNALLYVRGEFLTWPDSDDILYTEAIEKKVKYLKENPECGVVVCHGKKVMENDIDNSVGTLMISHNAPFENLFERFVFEEGVYFAPAGFMVKSDCFFKSLKGRNIYNSAVGQNWQMILPIAYEYKFGFIDEVLFDYVVRNTSHSRKEKNYQDNIKKTYAHEDCIVNTIATIDMPDGEKNKLYSDIKIKYIRKRMNIASKFLVKDDVTLFFKELKSLDKLLKQDIVTYKRITFPVYNFYYVAVSNIKSIIKRIIKNAFGR